MIPSIDYYPFGISLDTYTVTVNSQAFYLRDSLMPLETVGHLCNAVKCGNPTADNKRQMIVRAFTTYIKDRLRQNVAFQFNPFERGTVLTLQYVSPAHEMLIRYEDIMYSCYGKSFHYGNYKNGDAFNFINLATYMNISGYIHSQHSADPWDISPYLLNAINQKLTYLLRGY